MADGWRPDVLPGYEQLTLALPGARREGDEAVDPVATLVRRRPAQAARPAVLYVHGWNDYFFQAHLGDFFDSVGYDFYALDLRRYGRSLREGQLGGYITDVCDYDEELDAAHEVMTSAGHPSVVLHGHSTGGLVLAVHAANRPGRYAALVLNAPWLDMRNQPAVRRLARAIDAAAGLSPTRPMPGRKADGMGHYARTIHAGHDGEWEYDLAWKSNAEAYAVRVGWLRAIIRGQRRVARGLGLTIPVAVLMSASSLVPASYDVEACSEVDVVLDVKALAATSVRLGSHVTVVRIERGMHDLALSRPEPRQRYFDEVARWLGAYGPTAGAGPTVPRASRP